MSKPSRLAPTKMVCHKCLLEFEHFGKAKSHASCPSCREKERKERRSAKRADVATNKAKRREKIDKILELALSGKKMTADEIGALCDCSGSVAASIIKGYKEMQGRK